MNASNIFTSHANLADTPTDEISTEIKETLTLLKQFYDVPIVKFIDFREVYSEQLITCNDKESVENELLSYQLRCTQEKLYLFEDTFFDDVSNNTHKLIRFYAQYPIYSVTNKLIGVVLMADLAPKTLIGSQKNQFISFAQLLQTQLNKNSDSVSNQSTNPVKKNYGEKYIHVFSLAPVAFLIALVLCSFTALLLYTIEKKELQSNYNEQTQQLRKTLFNALERFDNQGLYISQKDLVIAGFLQSQNSYTKEQLNDLVQSQVSQSLTYKGYIVFDSEYNQLALWSKNNFDLAAYGFKNWLEKFNNRANKQAVEVFTVADTAFLISEIKIKQGSIYTLTAFDLSKFLKAVIGKLNTENYNVFIATPQFTLGKQGEVSPSIIKNSISALSSRFPPTWRLHVQPMNKIVRPQITKYSLIRLGLISFCVFAFVYYFLRLPRRLHNEIKQKNQLILNREELFSSSLDALPHGFAIFNSHEFPVITNNAFNLLFAQVNKQNSQLSYSQLVSIAQQNNIINHYHEHHKLDDDRNQLIDIGFTDGKWITVLQRHTDFNGFVCYFRDDTEAHQKECLLADVLEKSKQTNQLKEKFVTRLSRQLKTPLSSLKSLVEISKDPISFNEFKNNVGNISDACDQLESVIQQLVNINKSEIGKLKLQAKNVNLNHMINNNISILTKEAENKKIVLKNNITPGLTVVSDEKLISQLVIQLVTEVLDSSNNTTLSINAQIKNESNRNYLHLDFSLSNLIDSSYFITELKSISGDDIARLIDDIARLIDDKDVSLELKFFISIFKMLGGKAITVSSNANKSTITLSMLVNKVTKQDKDNVQKVPSSSLNTDLVKASLVTKNHQNTLLLVDDDPLVEIVIRAMLKDQNIIIDYACSAIEAMLMVSQNSYDIILMDIVMPELSGTDAMLKIKKHSDNSKTKIIAHTSTPDTESKYVNQGFDDMLLKPVKQGVLINQITRILKR